MQDENYGFTSNEPSSVANLSYGTAAAHLAKSNFNYIQKFSSNQGKFAWGMKI